MSHSKVQIAILFDALKIVMKKKGIIYKQIAKRLDMSEAGVKKIFSLQKMSIHQLVDICDEIGVSLADLIALNESFRLREFIFTTKQEEFFSEHPIFFNFFRSIFFEGLSLSEVKLRYRLSDRSILKYLKELEKYNLLELHPNNKIHFKVYGRLRWIDDGPWMKKYYKTFNEKLCERVSHKSYSGIKMRSVGFFTLPKKQIECFLSDFQELENRYRDKAYDQFVLGRRSGSIDVSWNFQIAEGRIETNDPKISETTK